MPTGEGVRADPYWGEYGDGGLPHRFVLWAFLRGLRSDCDIAALWELNQRLRRLAAPDPRAGDVGGG